MVVVRMHRRHVEGAHRLRFAGYVYLRFVRELSYVGQLQFPWALLLVFGALQEVKIGHVRESAIHVAVPIGCAI